MIEGVIQIGYKPEPGILRDAVWQCRDAKTAHFYFPGEGRRTRCNDLLPVIAPKKDLIIGNERGPGAESLDGKKEKAQREVGLSCARRTAQKNAAASQCDASSMNEGFI